MTPTPDDIARDDVVRVRIAIDYLVKSVQAAEYSTSMCGREEAAKAMYALENVMRGFWSDVARIIVGWDA